jgi:hypothetical protein
VFEVVSRLLVPSHYLVWNFGQNIFFFQNFSSRSINIILKFYEELIYYIKFVLFMNQISEKSAEFSKGQLGHKRAEPEPVPISAVTQAGGLCKGTSTRASYKTGTKIRL